MSSTLIPRDTLMSALIAKSAEKADAEKRGTMVRTVTLDHAFGTTEVRVVARQHTEVEQLRGYGTLCMSTGQARLQAYASPEQLRALSLAAAAAADAIEAFAAQQVAA
jgi:hypothetical protein